MPADAKLAKTDYIVADNRVEVESGWADGEIIGSRYQAVKYVDEGKEYPTAKYCKPSEKEGEQHIIMVKLNDFEPEVILEAKWTVKASDKKATKWSAVMSKLTGIRDTDTDKLFRFDEKKLVGMKVEVNLDCQPYVVKSGDRQGEESWYTKVKEIVPKERKRAVAAKPVSKPKVEEQEDLLDNEIPF